MEDEDRRAREAAASSNRLMVLALLGVGGRGHADRGGC